MTRFIVNITLHSAAEADYKVLSSEMAKESFDSIKKNVAKANGYLLRLMEFTREGAFTIKELTDAACRAAKKTGKEFSFTVIKDKKPANHIVSGKHAAA